jgi:RNase adapter protein RapZ
MGEFVVIAGLSGAGRSQAANVLEDLGWFVIDNLPAALIDKVAELAQVPGSTIDRVALVAGPRIEPIELIVAVANLRRQADRVRVLFLDASTRALVRRFEDTRRRHPYRGSGDPGEARMVPTIERERAALDLVKEGADLVIDTSDFNVHQLRQRLIEHFGTDATSTGMQMTLLSFGYKHGLSLDVDLVIDCRFLPNPHWVEELRGHSGLHIDVREYVLGFPDTTEFLDRLSHLFDLLLPAYVKEGKSYLTIAFGCTGGQHRSVVMVEEMATRLRQRGYDLRVQHRDVGK